MYSKTGNTVDSAVNQAIHQGGVVDPNLGVGHQGNLGQGVMGHLPGQGHHMGQGVMGQGVMGQGVMGHLPGQSHMGQGIMGQGVNPSMTQDQTYGHTTLGTVSGFVGQGVSVGLGHHQNTVLPTGVVDPQIHGTGHAHGHHGAGTALGTGAAVGTGAALAHHQHAGTTGAGKGTITFRPIEARFNHDKDLLGKMDPYCKFKIGIHKGKSSVATGQGVAPVWNDSVTLKHKKQEFAKLKVKDQNKLKIDGTIGTAKIPLDQVMSQGFLDTWIPVSKKDTVTGEVHLIIEYSGVGGVGTIGTTGTTGTGHHLGHHTTASNI